MPESRNAADDIDEGGRSVPTDRPELHAHEGAPGRVVFVESDNDDGWIATDLTVDIEP